MEKKAVATASMILLMVGALGAVYIFKPTQAVPPLDMEIKCGGIVEKKPGESFTITITFKNKGTIEGTWAIAATFEGDNWIWKGEEKTLFLKPQIMKTLAWEGVVPENSAIDSFARLVVYYDNEFVALNWWIVVISGAELRIVDSNVR